MNNKAILIGHPSAHMETVIAELKLKGNDFIFVDPNNKEQMAMVAKMQNPAFEPPPIPYTNPYSKLSELPAPFIHKDDSLSGRKKFRKQNNRKHKKRK